MFHAPTTESKQQNESTRSQSTPEPVRERSASVPGEAKPSWPYTSRQQVARLHSTFGNQAVLRMLSRAPASVQTKLTVNQPGDQYEQVADRMADQVMRMTETRIQRACACSGSGGDCPECKKKEETGLQRATNVSSGGFKAPACVNEVLRSPGQPLDAATRAFMEPRFGYNFGQVRVHTGQEAYDSARAVNALAYTAGEHIVFGAGHYDPSGNAGRRLLAHELTHVVQQQSGGFAVQREPAQPSPQVAALAAEVEDLVRPQRNEKAALEKLNGLDQTMLPQVVKKLYDDSAEEYATDKTTDSAAFEKMEGKRRSFGLLNGTLNTPGSPDVQNVDVPRLKAAFDGVLNASGARPKTKDKDISEDGLKFIANPPNEGFCPNLYDDLSSGCGRGKGDCTIGIGKLVHKGICDGRAEEEPYKKGVTLEAETRQYKGRLTTYTKMVNDNVKVELSQCQFDAMVSFAYNANKGGLDELLPTLNAGKFDEMPELIKKTRTNGGVLTLRRNREADLFANCNYKPTK